MSIIWDKAVVCRVCHRHSELKELQQGGVISSQALVTVLALEVFAPIEITGNMLCCQLFAFSSGPHLANAVTPFGFP